MPACGRNLLWIHRQRLSIENHGEPRNPGAFQHQGSGTHFLSDYPLSLSTQRFANRNVSPSAHTVRMIEIRPLYPRDWEPSEPLVAYNNADRRVVVAAAMRRGDGSYYDRYGYQGSQDIVCIDCKEAGRDVPVILVEAEKRSFTSATSRGRLRTARAGTGKLLSTCTASSSSWTGPATSITSSRGPSKRSSRCPAHGCGAM